MSILLKKMNISVFGLTMLMSTLMMAEEPVEIQPLTKAEIEQGVQVVKQDLNNRIDTWAESLKPEDFERSWTGRQLNKQKRQEVCGIFQSVIDHTYKLGLENKNRLAENEQKIIEDRNLFIESLGFKDNLVDTKLGFNCRLR